MTELMESCFNLPTKRCILCAYNSLPCYLLTFSVFLYCNYFSLLVNTSIREYIYACLINFLNLLRNSFLNCLTINIISISTNTNRHKNEVTIFCKPKLLAHTLSVLVLHPKTFTHHFSNISSSSEE